MDSEEIPDEDTLRRKYWDEGKSINEIADETGVFEYHIWREMKKQGIERRDRRANVRFHEPAIRTHSDGYEYLVYNDGKSRSVKMHRLNALVDHSINELEGNHVHHKNGVTWLNHPDNLSVLTPSEHGSEHAPKSRKKSWDDYATPLHFYVEEGEEHLPNGEKSPGIRVYEL